nr:MAG TPA: hypothetical protein [Caudoviricetes sp.]
MPLIRDGRLVTGSGIPLELPGVPITNGSCCIIKDSVGEAM